MVVVPVARLFSGFLSTQGAKGTSLWLKNVHEQSGAMLVANVIGVLSCRQFSGRTAYVINIHGRVSG